MIEQLPTALPCSLLNPVGCVTGVVGVPGAIADSVVSSAWDSVCRSFADGAVAMLGFFAKAFVAMPAVDLQSGGVRDVYAICLALSGTVAVILLLIQTAKTALTHDGSALAYGLVGLAKAALAFLLTLTVAGTALVAADEVTAFIVNRTFGNADGLRAKLTGLFSVADVGSPSLLLLLALLCMLLVGVLWFELLLRNAAVAILIATSPIAAAGQVSEATKDWWPRLVAATIQLIVLKPVIALTFALGLTFTGEGKDIATILSGLLVLLLAVLAWPAIARFFTFASVQTGGGMGLAGLIGAASNTANARNGMPVGQDPNQFSQAAEARTMGAHAGRTAATGAGGASAGAGASGAGAGAAGQAGAAAGATAATGGAAAAVFAVKAGLDAAQKGANALVGKSEQMAGHAGMNGNPHAAPAGYPRHAPPQWPAQSTPPPTGEQEQPPDDPPSPPPASDAELPARGVSPVQHERPEQARVIEPGQPERGGTQ